MEMSENCQKKQQRDAEMRFENNGNLTLTYQYNTRKFIKYCLNEQPLVSNTDHSGYS